MKTNSQHGWTSLVTSLCKKSKALFPSRDIDDQGILQWLDESTPYIVHKGVSTPAPPVSK